MRRIILALLAPVIDWATKDKMLHRAIWRDHTGAAEVFFCPCGLQCVKHFDLDEAKTNYERMRSAAYDHAEGCPALGPGDYQTY